MTDDRINCNGDCAFEPTSPVEMARHLRRMLKEYSKEEIAAKIDKPVSWIDRILKKGDTMKHIMNGRLYLEDDLLGAKFMVHAHKEGGFSVLLTHEGEEIGDVHLESIEQLGPWLLEQRQML